MGSWYHNVSDGLEFDGSGSALRQGETFLSGGGVGLPSGLSQSPPLDPGSDELSPGWNPMRAYQKLVWSIDMVDGKSMMNLPS